MFKSLRANQQGMSLTEIMLALVVVGIVLSVGFDITNASNQTNARTKIYSSANASAFAKIQDYETTEFYSIPNGDPVSQYVVEDFTSEMVAKYGNLVPNPTGTVKVEPTSGSLKKVRVIVEFQYGSRMRNVEYATYVQLGGVGR